MNMQGNFGTGTDETYEATRFFGSQMTALPTDDFMLWDAEQVTSAEVCATLFANEYLYDFNGVRAMLRLGVAESEAPSLAKSYCRHWLVLRKLREAVQNFRKQQIATDDNVLSLMYRDACNFDPDANPIARVSAQRQLAKVLCMEPDDRLRAMTHEASPNGGVMVVDGLGTIADWEARAAEAQAKLKQEVTE
jgi:hypothetical protein